jgi:thymidylate synthase (FAD)
VVVKFVSQTQIDPEYAAELSKDSAILLSVQEAEGLMAYVARVSSPNQTNPTYEKLLKYCIEHKHWSVFEMIDVTIEIETSRAIAQQILRHRSFSFQEFSQRYAKASARESYRARRQDLKNRQNSVDDLSQDVKEWFSKAQTTVWENSKSLYEEALDLGIAKECARFLLPLSTQTRLYMKGSLRSWMHYLDLRSSNGTQEEHAEIARAIREIMKKKFPVVSSAMGW